MITPDQSEARMCQQVGLAWAVIIDDKKRKLFHHHNVSKHLPPGIKSCVHKRSEESAACAGAGIETGHCLMQAGNVLKTVWMIIAQDPVSAVCTLVTISRISTQEKLRAGVSSSAVMNPAVSGSWEPQSHFIGLKPTPERGDASSSQSSCDQVTTQQVDILEKDFGHYTCICIVCMYSIEYCPKW